MDFFFSPFWSIELLCQTRTSDFVGQQVQNIQMIFQACHKWKLHIMSARDNERQRCIHDWLRGWTYLPHQDLSGYHSADCEDVSSPQNTWEDSVSSPGTLRQTIHLSFNVLVGLIDPVRKAAIWILPELMRFRRSSSSVMLCSCCVLKEKETVNMSIK